LARPLRLGEAVRTIATLYLAHNFFLACASADRNDLEQLARYPPSLLHSLLFGNFVGVDNMVQQIYNGTYQMVHMLSGLLEGTVAAAVAQKQGQGAHTTDALQHCFDRIVCLQLGHK
jgi:hypothetical protein